MRTLGLMQRMKLVPVERSFSMRASSWLLNLLPTLMKVSFPRLPLEALLPLAKSAWMKGFWHSCKKN
jgi:hypothetical protein